MMTTELDASITQAAPTPVATSDMKLSAPQASLVDKLRGGAFLRHQPNGIFKLQEGAAKRTIHPATVDALIRAGVLYKSLDGHIRLE
jgi:hypothetical protein